MKQHGLYYELVESQEGSVTQDDIAELSNQNSTAVLTDEVTFTSTNLIKEQNKSHPTSPNGNEISVTEFSDRNFCNQEISIRKIMKMNQPEWGYIALGVVGAVMFGVSTPIYAIVFGEIMGLLDHSLEEDVYHLNDVYAFVSLIYHFFIFTTSSLL